MRLKDLRQTPPIGFVYRDHETGELVSGDTFMELLQKVNQHRHLNGLVLNGNQEQMIHDQICDRIGSEYCEGKGLGDMVHAVAQPIAKIIDSVAGTKIQKCGACAKRRANLNS